MLQWLFELPWWAYAAIVGTLAALAGYVAARVAAAVLLRVTRPMPVLHLALRAMAGPATYLLPLLALQVVWYGLSDAARMVDAIAHLNGLLLLAALTWFGVRAVQGVADGVISRHPLDVDNNLQARRIRTQTTVLARTVMVLVLLAGVSMMLMTFPGARQIGTSLLASAGLAGIVVGFAAKSVFSNLIAGLQIAITQPITIDDVLIVNGEWGRVEEITGTYVVLAIWDQRRLIIPLQWFIENPFENWTKRNSELIGTVFLWVDYTTPLEPLRAEALRLCQSTPEWDGRLCKLHVFETSDRAMQLRFLVTARDASQAFELRAKVREGLVDFLQREHPQCLPRVRTEIDHPAPRVSELA